eukprot:6130894-Amphidinium_carterae.2
MQQATVNFSFAPLTLACLWEASKSTSGFKNGGLFCYPVLFRELIKRELWSNFNSGCLTAAEISCSISSSLFESTSSQRLAAGSKRVRARFPDLGVIDLQDAAAGSHLLEPHLWMKTGNPATSYTNHRRISCGIHADQSVGVQLVPLRDAALIANLGCCAKLSRSTRTVQDTFRRRSWFANP